MRPHGFTLIELSIVLVILGMIVGGIVGGRALVHQAELGKIISDLQSHKVAFNAYRAQYDALPGDHKEATLYWPSKTQDGDGDGQICDGNCWASIGNMEDSKTWQHMNLAEITPFTPDGTLFPRVIGGTHPKGPIKGQGYLFQSYARSQGIDLNSGALHGKRGVFLRAARFDSTSDRIVFLTPADARNVDTKMDDGRPATGQMMANEGSGATYGDCIAGNTAFAQDTAGTNKYNVSNANIACTLESLLD